MNGDKICQHLKKTKPKAKILLASGYVGVYSEMDMSCISAKDSVLENYRYCKHRQN